MVTSARRGVPGAATSATVGTRGLGAGTVRCVGEVQAQHATNQIMRRMDPCDTQNSGAVP